MSEAEAETGVRDVVGEPLPVVFNGKAGEYFGIWIVNVLLTIVTIGIYSAWAKVRTNRYFYGSTTLDGSAFSYHAKPLQILFARIIVIAVLAVIGAVLEFEPLTGILIYPALLFLFPWLVAKSFRFQARVTRWRNVGFDFRTDYWPAFVTVILVPIITVITFGLGAPVATKLTQEWAYNRYSFGDRPFRLELGLGPLYGLFGLVVLAGVVLLAVAGGIAAIPLALTGGDVEAGLQANPFLMAPFAVAYILLLSISLLGLVYQAGVRNIVFREALLDDVHRFHSTISKRRYAWIMVTNLIAIGFTLGLLIPWARIRVARFIAENTYVIPGGPIDQFVENVKESQGVIGEEYVDIEGVDIGIGL